MSITNELREFASEIAPASDMRRILEIADRIDAEHEKRMAVNTPTTRTIAHACIEVTPHIDWQRMADEAQMFAQTVSDFARKIEDAE